MDADSPKSFSRPLIVILLILAVCLMLFIFFPNLFPFLHSNQAVISPAVDQETLLGKKPLNQSQADAIFAHKQEILKRVSQLAPLTEDEKGAIGNLMLTQAHLYQFTPDERDTIFAALKR